MVNLVPGALWIILKEENGNYGFCSPFFVARVFVAHVTMAFVDFAMLKKRKEW